jgi:benzoyl-CoA reductase/2-hydroxyglutaryl-CoA dehydratase subunit BcrC/BadD/HgdB
VDFLSLTCLYEAKRYVTTQIYDFIKFLEEATGKKMDFDRMNQVGKLSLEGQRLWQKVLNTTTNRPAPMTAFDAFFHLALIVTLRGTETVVTYYKELLAEMEQRVADGISMVPNEKYRLVWDNLPVWYRTKWLSDKFAQRNAALVTDTYTSAWAGVIDLIDENNFLESMAIAYSSIYINISIDKMFESLKKMIIKYNADGLVMHSNRSCKPYSLGQYDLQRMVMKELDIPTLTIEADMVDQRAFSESQIETRIDAFMEIMEEQKK